MGRSGSLVCHERCSSENSPNVTYTTIQSQVNSVIKVPVYGKQISRFIFLFYRYDNISTSVSLLNVDRARVRFRIRFSVRVVPAGVNEHQNAS